MTSVFIGWSFSQESLSIIKLKLVSHLDTRVVIVVFVVGDGGGVSVTLAIPFVVRTEQHIRISVTCHFGKASA